MKKIVLIVLIILIILILGGFLIFRKTKKTENKMVPEEKILIRKPAVAGQFYPEKKEDLERIIDEYLEKANPQKTEGEILALILPHAGYQFSGKVAAFGFKKLIGEEIDTVILIGNSHYYRFDGIAIFPEGFWETPLGRIKVDSDLANQIKKESERIFFSEEYHQKEHSLEVQIPFLQKTLKDFKILPILLGNSDQKDFEILAKAISKNIKGKNVLLIASSDLSHYPSYDDAKLSDQKVIEAILSGEIENLEITISDLSKKQIFNALTFACGEDSIKTVILVAKELGSNEIKLLKYANSGDATGDLSRVVGYSAIGFFGERRGNLLNKKEKRILLEIARKTLETFILEGKIPEFKVDSPYLNQKLGAFVTIKKNEQLRGCIGTFSPTEIPLYQVVSQMSIAAGTQDLRFYPVQKEELKDLEYEISVLSNLEEIDDWQKIEVGKHGVVIRVGGRSGTFLPQVAKEQNWDLETFLEMLCLEKLGLEKNCYKRKDAKIYVFSAQVFGEKEVE